MNSALTTWKDIAQHFDRDVRTVQRWEKEEGLPVHRHIHQRKSSVYAYSEELERWWRERGEKLLAEPVATPVATQPRRWIVHSVSMVAIFFLLLVGWKLLQVMRAPVEPSFHAAVLDATRPNGNLSMPLTGDLNGDGNDDVVLSAGHAREIYVLFGGKPLPSHGDLPVDASVVISGSSNGWWGAGQVADFNGDGIKDLLVSHVLAEPESYTATGSSYILWGRKKWPSTLVLPDAANVSLNLNVPTDTRMSGCNVGGSRQDLNGDGIEDAIFAAPEYSFGEDKSAGAMLVVYGRKNWPRELEVSAAAGAIFRGAKTGAGFAGPCALGDFNGDGKVDLAAFSNQHTLWNLLGGKGELALFAGGNQWPAMLDAEADASLRLQGEHRELRNVTILLADLNGDGVDDLITGWIGYANDPKSPGVVRVWFGRADRKGVASASSADVVISGSREGGQFGHSILVEDVDEDGLADLIVAEPGSGQAYLLYGRKDWAKSARVSDIARTVLFRGDVGAGAWRMAFADLDGDHLPELILTSIETSAKAEKAGRAWIVKPYLPVALDVRPEREPNVLLWPGMVVARILGNSKNPQERINPATMRLAGAPATRLVEQDFNGDGISDWQAYFDSAAMKISSATKQVVFLGRTQSGLPVAGTDAVVVMPQVSNSKRNVRN